VFTSCTEDIDRAEVLYVEDFPKFTNFCPKKHPEKELDAPTTTVCARWARTNDQGQFVIPLQLERGLTLVHFNDFRRWTEAGYNHSSIRCFDSVFPECEGHLKARWTFKLAQKTESVKNFSAKQFFFRKWDFFKIKTFPGNTPVGTVLVIVIADKAANSRGL